MKKVLYFLCWGLTLITPIWAIVKGIQFNQDCGGYLKQAADANSVELAIDRLDKAIEYCEKHNLTDGYTSVLWRTETDNVEFWYQNLKTCKEELELCRESSQFEKTNVLMKVRESLTDNGEKGTVITKPNGISRYPNNTLYGIFMWLSLIVMFILSCVYVELDYNW